MKNFIKADFYRIMTKRSRIILMVIFVVLRMLRLFSSVSDPGINAYEATDLIGGIDWIYVLVIMLVNLFIVYGDDIKARSMQVAIGLGVERKQIVIAKWISTVMMFSCDMIFLTVSEFLGVGISGKLAGSFMIAEVLWSKVVVLLELVMAVTLSMIVTFLTQKAVLGVMMYLLVNLSALDLIMQCFEGEKIVQKLRLWEIGPVTQLDRFMTKVSLGLFDIKSLVMIIVYLALGFGLTIHFFKKKELDF